MTRVSAVLAALGLVIALLVSGSCGEPAPGGGGEWADHMGGVPFLVGGYEDGLAAANERGKPPVYFLTAHW